MKGMEEAGGEPGAYRWWLRFVVVPIGGVIIGASLGYFLRPRVPEKTAFPAVRRSLLDPGTIALLADDAAPELESLHSQVKAAIRRNDLAGALEVTGSILRNHPASPRASYNKACVLSLLAAKSTDQAVRARYLDQAEVALRDALEFGITNAMKLLANGLDPTNQIATDSDLQTLFSERRGAKQLLDEFSSEDKPKTSVAGGGCIGAEMKVELPSHRYKRIDALREGDAVLSVDPGTAELVRGRVTMTRILSVRRVLRINDRLVVTPPHPIKTPAGWIPAGELVVGDRMSLAAGGEEVIQSLSFVEGTFTVVDISVEPSHCFIVEGVFVHNKWILQ